MQVCKVVEELKTFVDRHHIHNDKRLQLGEQLACYRTLAALHNGGKSLQMSRNVDCQLAYHHAAKKKC